MKMFLPNFEKGVRGNPFNSNPYLVTTHWKALITIKIMMLRRGFYDIPGQNVALL